MNRCALPLASGWHPSPWLWLVVVPLLAVQWVIACGVIRRRGGFTAAAVAPDPGPTLARSGWGSAVINGTPFGRCVRLTTHADGWAVRLMPIFGGGVIWLPRATTVVCPVTTARFGRRQQTLTNGSTVIRLTEPTLADG